MNETERVGLKDHLNMWIDMMANLINSYGTTTEREQHTIPLRVENWVARVLEHLNTDTDIRNEGILNLK